MWDMCVIWAAYDDIAVYRRYTTDKTRRKLHTKWGLGAGAECERVEIVK